MNKELKSFKHITDQLTNKYGWIKMPLFTRRTNNEKISSNTDYVFDNILHIQTNRRPQRK